MSVAAAVAALAAYGLASFALGAVLYYRLGQRAVAKAIAVERQFAQSALSLKERAYSLLSSSHSAVSAKLAVVKAEVEKMEADLKTEWATHIGPEAKSAYQSAVSRIKAVL